MFRPLLTTTTPHVSSQSVASLFVINHDKTSTSNDANSKTNCKYCGRLDQSTVSPRMIAVRELFTRTLHLQYLSVACYRVVVVPCPPAATSTVVAVTPPLLVRGERLLWSVLLFLGRPVRCRDKASTSCRRYK